jgi:hypothetical protein
MYHYQPTNAIITLRITIMSSKRRIAKIVPFYQRLAGRMEDLYKKTPSQDVLDLRNEARNIAIDAAAAALEIDFDKHDLAYLSEYAPKKLVELIERIEAMNKKMEQFGK